MLQLDFTRIVTASAVVALLSIFLLIPLTLVAAVARGPHPVRRALLKPLVHALFFGTIIYFTPGPEGTWWVLLGYLFLIAALEFLPPAFKRAPGTTYLERLSAQLSEDERATRDRSAKGGDSTLDRLVLIPAAAVLFGGLIVFGIGRHHAQEQTTYWVMAEDPKKLLVENCGDLFLFKSFDPISRQLGSELLLVKVSDSSPIALRRVHTGELVAAKLKDGG